MLCKYNIFQCYVNITALLRLRCTRPGSLFTRPQQMGPRPFAQIAGPSPHLQSSISFTLHNLYLRCVTSDKVLRALLRTTFLALHCITLFIRCYNNIYYFGVTIIYIISVLRLYILFRCYDYIYYFGVM